MWRKPPSRNCGRAIYHGTPQRATVPGRTVIVVLAVLLLGPCLATSSARVDPDTGRIRTLFIGSVLVGIGYPAPAMIEDPKIELTRVEAQIGSSNPLLGFENMQRFLRLYLPRSGDDLLQNYDMLIVTGIRSDDLKYCRLLPHYPHVRRDPLPETAYPSSVFSRLCWAPGPAVESNPMWPDAGRIWPFRVHHRWDHVLVFVDGLVVKKAYNHCLALGELWLGCSPWMRSLIRYPIRLGARYSS
jgi:hypothetical protein